MSIKRTDAHHKRAGFSSFKLFALCFAVLVILLIPMQFGIDGLLDKPIVGGGEELPDDIKIPQMDPDDPNYLLFSDSERLNILLLGVKSGLTDTIMLGSYDMKNQKLDLISVPRDTYFEREEARTAAQKKINAIYYKGGASGTAKAVSEVLAGMPIHYYVVVKYEGVAEAVDAVGGVPVYISINMDYDDPYDKPPLHIHFEKGEHLLNGDEAVRYLRFRKNNNGGGYPRQDIDRIQAQQDFMKAALGRAMGLNLPKVAGIVLDNVESDLTVGVTGKLAAKAAGLDAENIVSHLTPGESHMQNGLSYWFVDAA